jgi:hypothetical protein
VPAPVLPPVLPRTVAPPHIVAAAARTAAAPKRTAGAAVSGAVVAAAAAAAAGDEGEGKAQSADSYHARGFGHRKRGDFHAAIRDYTRAIEMEPRHFKVCGSERERM